MSDDGPELVLIFAHGTVTFRFALAERDRCDIQTSWDVRHVSRLCIQLPIVVWHGAKVLFDGQEAAGRAYTRYSVKRDVQAVGGAFESRLTVRMPDGAACGVHYPLPILRTYGGLFENETFDPPFELALASCQWSTPGNTGRAVFTVFLQ